MRRWSWSCTAVRRTPRRLDHVSGWSGAGRHDGFALLYPEQQRGTTANLCFNWFSLADARRGGGEALSISQMVDANGAAHGSTRAHLRRPVLSAGGAMTARHARGLSRDVRRRRDHRGLPYGNADSVGEALARMRGQGLSASDTSLTAMPATLGVRVTGRCQGVGVARHAQTPRSIRRMPAGSSTSGARSMLSARAPSTVG